MERDFDVIIPIAMNDVIALKNILPYIFKIFQNNKITIIANKNVLSSFTDEKNLRLIDENEMLPGLQFNSIKKIINRKYPKAVRRTGWYFQQFLKLGYSRICEKEYYLSWDSDTIPLNKIDFFTELGEPYLSKLPPVLHDKAYDTTISNLWPDGSVKKREFNSFVTEHMMFSKRIVTAMLSEIECMPNLNGEYFFEKIMDAIPINELNLSGFSEFDTYAAFVRSKFPEEYVLRDWHNLRHGKAYFGENPSETQLMWVEQSFDVVSIEDFDKQMFLCKFLTSEKIIKRIPFKKIYLVIEPIIKIKYFIRMRIRALIRK